MIVVDSSGWMHYFMNGQLAEAYAGHLSKLDQLVTPTVVLYEVFRKIKASVGEDEAVLAAEEMEQTHVVDFSSAVAYHAANLSIKYQLSFADAIIYATTDLLGAKLVTSDKDFKDLPKVLYINPEEEF